MKERFKIIAAVFGVFIRDGKVLLLERQNTGYADGMFSLPAGHVEAGESLEQAIMRELKEEVGVTVEASELKLAHVRSRNREDGHRVNFFFLVSGWQMEPVNLEPQKCGGLEWYTFNQLPDNLLPDIRDSLECILRDQAYSEDGWLRG